MPAIPESWMVAGKTYAIVVKRSSTIARPEVEVYDPMKPDRLLATLPMSEAIRLFGL